jgi:pSer/pThr/pTyr-binding forkhead associated (FHA) protein
MFKLVIQDDEGKTTVVPLIRDEITIGRKEGNTIRLTERNVSRRHARILRNNGEVQIEDLGSYNGIRVNNARIAERVSLRVSDQVQIGDYKLYLKAEGVEQVDEARTMPIERVDNALATEVMPAVSPSSPTQPISAQAAAAAAAPARPPVSGTGDTDPAGRPVANAAQVAALSQVAAYGKLVVISSNFAGKEFDLTRPQMIVGRTDENDIVVNHRSISRNHAKVTRDPETGRYTISDLQSSNGVRVNGQDYGKVELRRGDTIDLGHVRMRFVEPGEDWIFARDAVIADVAEPGGKKGLLVAIVLGVLVLVGVGAFVMLKKSGGDEDGKKTNTGNLASGNEHNVASGNDVGTPNNNNNNVGETPADGPEVAVAPNNNNNNATVTPPGNDDKLECLNLITEKKWQDLDNCAHKFTAKDQDQAKKWIAQANAEQKNEISAGKLDEAIKQGDLSRARKLLEKIDDDSVYKKSATASYNGLAKQIIDDYKGKASRLAAQHKCGDVDRLAQQAAAQGPEVAAEVRGVKCEAIVATGDHGGGTPKNPPGGAGSGGGAATPPPANCDADAMADKGSQDEAIGQHAAALKQFELAYKCKPSERLLRLAFMSSCNSGDLGKSKQYYKKLPAGPTRANLAQMCVRAGITIQQLDAP